MIEALNDQGSPKSMPEFAFVGPVDMSTTRKSTVRAWLETKATQGDAEALLVHSGLEEQFSFVRRGYLFSSGLMRIKIFDIFSCEQIINPECSIMEALFKSKKNEDVQAGEAELLLLAEAVSDIVKLHKVDPHLFN